MIAITKSIWKHRLLIAGCLGLVVIAWLSFSMYGSQLGRTDNPPAAILESAEGDAQHLEQIAAGNGEQSDEHQAASKGKAAREHPSKGPNAVEGEASEDTVSSDGELPQATGAEDAAAQKELQGEGKAQMEPSDSGDGIVHSTQERPDQSPELVLGEQSKQPNQPNQQHAEQAGIGEQPLNQQQPGAVLDSGGERVEEPVRTEEEAAEDSKTQSDTVLLSIIGPADKGNLLASTELELKPSDTVLDLLKRATRSGKIPMEYRGSGAGAYVEGIDNVYEFDYGPGSGWMYSVNGKFPDKGAGVWEVNAGDKVEWKYTEDLGADVGAGAEDGLWDGSDE